MKQNVKKSHGPLVKRKSLPWVYCRKCGLLYLKNEATARAIRQPCPGADEDDDA